MPDHNPQPGTPAQPPPPVLDYSSGSSRRRLGLPLLPNPPARQSLLCGLGLIAMLLLQSFLFSPGAPLPCALDLAFVVMWIVVSVAAVVLGVNGYRRTRNPDVGGVTFATVGGLLGLLGLGVVLANVIGSFYDRYVTHGPTGAATRWECARRLTMIEHACRTYAFKHSGQYPSSFAELCASRDLEPYDLICPGSNDTVAPWTTRKEIPAAVVRPGHCSYIYVGAGLTTSVPGKTVLAYEKPTNHAGKGMNVLYADASVTWLSARDAAKLIATLPPPPTTQPSTWPK